MPLEIIRNDITKVSADAIVNTANPNPIYGDGTDYAIYHAAGVDDLLNERKKIGKIARGEVAVTSAFKLNAKYIIHTVGPVWKDGMQGEFETLIQCYEHALEKAVELKCNSVAFPLISSGSYGFPKDKALSIATSTISNFLFSHDLDVILVIYDLTSFQLSSKLVSSIDSYIDENYIEDAASKMREDEWWKAHRRDKSERRYSNSVKADERELACILPVFDEPKQQLEDVLAKKEDSFADRLFKFIDDKGLTDVEVYKKANMDRKLFSSIRSKKNYKPSKKTVFALSISLELNIHETEDLLSRAGLAFDPTNKGDIIIKYFIENHSYDIFEINNTLFEYQQPTLFGEI